MRNAKRYTIEEKVFSFIREHRMLLPGDRVVAGISGGADSVCLLFVLCEWRRRYGLELAAVHVNHGIRPEAGEDARFTEELCARLEVPFYLREADVRELARQQRCSEEEAGRDLRYQAFAEVAHGLGAKIAVAHNLNDCSETMLFHLFRGSGMKGLAGIAPKRGEIIRPLLCLERAEIEAYLAELGQGYCTDATNDRDDYTRNRIRHHILPYAEEEIVSGCVRHIGQTAEILSEADDYLEQQTQIALEKAVKKERDGYCVDCAEFAKFHPAIRKRMLFALAKSLSPGAKDISYQHITALHSLFLQEGNRRICLPFGIRGRREYGRVILERRQQAEEENKDFLQGIRVAYEVLAREDLTGNSENSLIFPQNQYTKWFDYDKIKEPPVLRARRQGDYLTIRDGQGALHRKSLKEYMIEEKIPCDARDSVPLLAEGAHILWIVGYRISEYYKIDENTKQILQVQLITDF